jgi:hypothetical protein
MGRRGQTLEEVNKMEKYNGWSNFTTWVANLWIRNNEYDMAMWFKEAQNHLFDDAVLTYLMKDYYHERMLTANEAMNDACVEFGMFIDMLGYAFAFVNWTEIATHINEEAIATHINEEAKAEEVKAESEV